MWTVERYSFFIESPTRSRFLPYAIPDGNRWALFLEMLCVEPLASAAKSGRQMERPFGGGP
jgi:hypothetical protein